MHVKNVKTIAVDARDYNDEEKFDRVLVDAPCSGLGTLRKKPDIKWKRDLGDIRKLNATQKELLRKGASLVKVGGYLVYSTCTIDASENYEIINDFLMENPDFEIEKAGSIFDPELIDDHGCVHTYTNVHEIDGSFAARLKKIR